MLAKGYSPGEIASVAGVSRQLIHEWAKSALIDWRRIRDADVSKAWRHEDTVRRAKPTKRELRRQATRAKQAWDKARSGQR